ncbi:uncharacterized protein LOC111043053 [Myzus persicae]|uniref:uncharacterized protein LOC111043053 n=1 Tax=Myzus persicae TaxID=13164 RepID=UPI000B934052|nr:uncharacterized protein LOC111043053 [Myzus persicae]
MEKKYRLEKLANTNESEIGNIGENGKRNHNTQHEAGSNVSIEKISSDDSEKKVSIADTYSLSQQEQYLLVQNDDDETVNDSETDDDEDGDVFKSTELQSRSQYFRWPVGSPFSELEPVDGT